MRGRKPQPTVLKLLRDNPGKRRINQDEPRPGDLAPEIPAELTEPAARAEWERTIVPAIAIGHVKADNIALAILYCTTWAEWLNVLAEGKKHPYVIAAGKNQYPMPNPAWNMAKALAKDLKDYISEMGLSPVTRSRVETKGAPSTVKVDRDRRKFFGVSGG